MTKISPTSIMRPRGFTHGTWTRSCVSEGVTVGSVLFIYYAYLCYVLSVSSRVAQINVVTLSVISNSANLSI